jgi:hypothetical protein
MQGMSIGQSAGIEGWHCEDLTDAEWAWIGGGARGDPPGWLNYDPGFFADPLFINGGGGILSSVGGSAGAQRQADWSRFSYKTQRLSELYLCPRTMQTLRGVAFPTVTVTHSSGPDAGIPYLGSGTGSITLDFVRVIGAGNQARYAAVAYINFDAPVGGYLGGIVGTHYATVDCATGATSGGGLGILTP